MKRLLLEIASVAVLATAGAAPILQSGRYDTQGDLDRLSSVEVEITETNEFVATLVWWDHLPGPDGLERHVAEVRGTITSPKPGVVRFVSAAKPLRWPLDQEFSIVTDSEIRIEQGYWHVQPGGRLVRPPSEITYLVIKKVGEQVARPNAAEPPP